MTTKTKKPAALFPKLPNGRGGFTLKVHFSDEARGERYFDTEWDIRGTVSPDMIHFHGMVDYRGFRAKNGLPPSMTIGKSFRVGDLLTVYVTKWNTRGRTELPARTIRVTSVYMNQTSTSVSIGYEFPL